MFFTGSFIADLLIILAFVMLVIEFFINSRMQKRNIEGGIVFSLYRVLVRMVGLASMVLYTLIDPVAWICVALWFIGFVQFVLKLDEKLGTDNT